MDKRKNELLEYQEINVEHLKRLTLGLRGKTSEKSIDELISAIHNSGLTSEHNETPKQVLKNLTMITEQKGGICYDWAQDSFFNSIPEDNTRIYNLCIHKQSPNLFLISANYEDHYRSSFCDKFNPFLDVNEF